MASELFDLLLRELLKMDAEMTITMHIKQAAEKNIKQNVSFTPHKSHIALL